MHSGKLPYIVYFLGICYIAYLASSIQPDVFFSGDGGVKYMVVKQISNNEGFKYLHTTQPEWVKELWNEGFFPIKQPFTYPSIKGYIISFPPAFQIISAFFYAKFGYSGLYIIPISSILLLWMVFLHMLSYLAIDPYKKSVGLFVLIFCSPLTVYAATYWEHLPAVLLLSGGILFIIKKQTGVVKAFFIGLCCGLAVWLRPEAIVMNFLYALAVLWQYKQGKQHCVTFLGSMLVAMIAFFITNYTAYGSFLGAHSYQVLGEHTLIYSLIRGVKYMIVLNWLLFRFFCVIILTLFVFIKMYKKEFFDIPELKMIFGILVLYCIITPFIVPNEGAGQWGPRYLLPVIPLVLVILLITWQREKVSLPAYFTPAIVVIICYSLYLNVYEGGYNTIVKGNHNRVKPALDFVKHQSEKVIVVSSEFIPMEMGAIFMDRYFFLAENKNRLDSLNTVLRINGIKSCLYITDKNFSPGQPNLLNDSSSGLLQKGMYYLGKYKL